jgi:hypothetical protein
MARLFSGHTPPLWRLWLWWVAGHIIAGALVITVLRVATGLTDWYFFGVAFGLLQWLVIRQHSPRATFATFGWRWVVASSVGGVVARLINLSLDAPVYSMLSRSTAAIIDGAVYGIGLGVAQWLLLRFGSAQRGTAWWMLVNILGGAVGLPLAIAVNGAWFALLGEGGDGIAAWAAYGAAYGAITGVGVVRLLAKLAA